MELMVTGLRALVEAALRGEWELHRTWAMGGRVRDGDDRHVQQRGEVCAIREAPRNVCIMARDSAMLLWDGGFW